MVRFFTIALLTIAGFIFAIRYAISYSGFVYEGVAEGVQACKEDSDCIWVPMGCCSCDYGGREILINKDKEFMFNLLIKELCLEEQVCGGEDVCHLEDVYCDRQCKYGDRSYSKPILSR